MTYKGVIAGLVAGLLVALYRLGIEFGTEKSLIAYRFLKLHPIYIVPWLFLIAAVGYLTYRLVKLEPYAKGSGIPQVEGIVLFGMKMKWHTILIVRYLAGILTSLFGVSLGREGPSIQIGAAGSQAFAEKFGKNKLEENYLITAGASAGLSAAFNAPLSGIMFALEEIHRTFSPNILIAATTAALTADVVSKYFFGLKPVLQYTSIPQLPIRYYVVLLPLGVICGIVGAVTNKGLLGIDTFYAKLPAFLRPGAALLLALPFGLLLPQVLGGGQNLIKMSEGAQIGISLLTLFLVMKLLFTCICFGSGIPGGIFMPILSIGAMTGCIFGKLVAVWGLSTDYIPAFCVCAMAGVMSGSVKAPVTSILLMAEMTGSLIHLMPVAAVAFLALLTSDLLNISPIYEVLLERLTGQSKGSAAEKKPGAIIEIPVELGCTVAGKKVKDVSWPEGALIVSLCRGKKELLPNGDTEILPGDYLVVLSTEQRFDEMNRSFTELCHADP
ncbi:ClC family H(+)/Cl(-) exchange transporter [Caproiciproducens faecalis]|uniref:ClC family H(+)/Cl(-) exchange transporter n=1 Tax=Caproiciproducens faecalis TaxID=2820301 RepID=A0ABS7DP37_9FIRM|nr:ClC family H(+)/Cl(-) exchange transporter [Caproiciproducens faecalis]